MSYSTSLCNYCEQTMMCDLCKAASGEFRHFLPNSQLTRIMLTRSIIQTLSAEEVAGLRDGSWRQTLEKSVKGKRSKLLAESVAALMDGGEE